MKSSNLLKLSSVIASLGLLVTFSVASNAQQYHKLTQLDTSQAVCPGGIQTAAELQAFFSRNPGAAEAILADSGWRGDAGTLMAAIAAGKMSEQSYPVGTRMAWMGAKVNGQFIAKSYRQWAGSKSFSAFKIDMVSDCVSYEIAIPKACCNISLISAVPLSNGECSADNADDQNGRAAALAGAGAGAGAGAVDKAGSGADDGTGDGAYVVGAMVPFIAAFTGSEKRPRFETAWAMDMIDTASITGIRAGVLKNLSPNTAAFGQISYYDRSGINEGNVYPEDNFGIDIGLQRRIYQNMFVSGGVGLWNFDDADFSDPTLFGQIGGQLGQGNFQWFVEGRVFSSDSDNHDSLSENKMLSLGVRYLIK